MRKLLLLALVVGGFAYMSKKLDKAKDAVIERKAKVANKALEFPVPPHLTEGPRVSNDWMKEQAKRVNDMNEANRRAGEWQMKYAAQCAYASSNLAAISLSEKPQTGMKLQQSARNPATGRTTRVDVSDAARAQAKAQNEQFFREHCVNQGR